MISINNNVNSNNYHSLMTFLTIKLNKFPQTDTSKKQKELFIGLLWKRDLCLLFFSIRIQHFTKLRRSLHKCSSRQMHSCIVYTDNNICCFLVIRSKSLSSDMFSIFTTDSKPVVIVTSVHMVYTFF